MEDMLKWLEDAAVYFENRATNGEDSAHWANAYNAENARKIATYIKELETERKPPMENKELHIGLGSEWFETVAKRLRKARCWKDEASSISRSTRWFDLKPSDVDLAPAACEAIAEHLRNKGNN